jgi:RNA polymerase sigma-70 factor (ECF subfamily)
MRRSRSADDPAWFRRLYDDHAAAILAYALRRCSEPGDAADVVAEVFLVAWRRRPDVPAEDAARLWLFGVAKGVLANQHRGDLRRVRLAERLRAELGAGPGAARPSPPDPAAERVTEAMGTLPDGDRELLQLAVWDELSPSEIAALEGIPAATVRSRLHRARTRLRVALAEREPAAAPHAVADNRWRG